MKIHDQTWKWNEPLGIIEVIRQQNPNLSLNEVITIVNRWSDAAQSGLEGTAAYGAGAREAEV